MWLFISAELFVSQREMRRSDVVEEITWLSAEVLAAFKKILYVFKDRLCLGSQGFRILPSATKDLIDIN